MTRVDATSRDANRHTTVAACDRCKRECPESKEPGRGDWEANAAVAVAVRMGWMKQLRGRDQLLFCPECQK